MRRKRKYKQYAALAECLRRKKIKSHCKIASLFLDCFLENSGHIRASMVTGKKICSEGQFKSWVSSMSDWIEFDYAHPSKTKYIPTPKLLKYLNKEKLSNDLLVTEGDLSQYTKKADLELYTKKTDLDLYSKKTEIDEKLKIQKDAFDKELYAIKSELKEYKDAMDRVINIIEPPADKEKRKNFIAGKYDHRLRLVSGGFDVEKDEPEAL